MSKTKEEHNAYMKKWYAANKERLKAKAKTIVKTEEQKKAHNIISAKSYAKNREKCLEKGRAKRQLMAALKPIIVHTEEQKAQHKRDAEKANKYKKEYRLRNIEKARAHDKERYLKRRESLRAKDKLNREAINLRHKKYIQRRFKEDPTFKLNRYLSSYIKTILKRGGFSKKLKSQQILGCNPTELKQYLEGQFESWMTWDNHGKYNGELYFGWDIDHIIPVSSASTEDEVIRLNHYTNLRPLDGLINRYIKRDKIAS